MRAARSALFVLWGLVTLAPWATAAVLISPWVSSTRLYWFCSAWGRVLLWGLHRIVGVRVQLRGWDRLPQGRREAVIVLAKHQSALETLALFAYMPHPLAFVFKKELLYIPFFGWALGRMDMVHIDRSRRTEAFQKVVVQGRRLAAQGTWVIMFPEGTRVPRGAVGAYKTGGTRLACETGLPVQPVACATARVWPRRSLLLQPGEYVLSVGPALAPQGHSPDSLMAEVQRWIESEMQRLDPEAYTSRNGVGQAPAPQPSH
ncbi:lysophospholipid acyltransferase family protein [Inhella gelatinilytica]|uniref:1-acyl-sn-glycerol-3-phosphate acyltransferase n=1 Tax=Inhella gelatinilytica TaxID=2795030 RepID=A0A931IRE0_9BURK|nr:lysophospholipid acyltransferase family protein [Inhella gelatinilytica]MBH9551287.1 1-acyl-sn-glycerol-3-phosphate acyltransferase [Inhella gelatinilytica]